MELTSGTSLVLKKCVANWYNHPWPFSSQNQLEAPKLTPATISMSRVDSVCGLVGSMGPTIWLAGTGCTGSLMPLPNDCRSAGEKFWPWNSITDCDVGVLLLRSSA